MNDSLCQSIKWKITIKKITETHLSKRKSYMYLYNTKELFTKIEF